jgi:RNA polymerase sigma-70 factor (ECF subfamily)
VLQEALLRAWNNFASLQDEARMIPWLVRIMHNCWIDVCRKRTKHPTVSEIPEQATSTEELSPWQRITVDDFRRAVERLEEPYRTVVILRDIDGLTNDEISLRTGAPYATVATRVHRARKQLKDILQSALNAKEE